MQTALLFSIALLVGYYISTYVSKPVQKNGQPRPNRLPNLRVKNLEILPCFRLHVGSKTYWFHHWFYLSVIVIGALLIYDNLIHYSSAKAAAGAAVGGIIQGLRYPDRFKFRHPRVHH